MVDIAQYHLGTLRCRREGASTPSGIGLTIPVSPLGVAGYEPATWCTSDNGVHVHRNAIFMCAPALPYVAACLTVAARPPERRRRSGAFGRRRERPPLSGCLDRHRGGLACAHPCHPPRGGRSHQSIPGGKAVAPMRAIRESSQRAIWFRFAPIRASSRVRSRSASLARIFTHTSRPALLMCRCRWGGSEGAQPPASPCRGPAKRGPKG